MIEGSMDHTIRLGRPAAEALQVFQASAMRLRAGGEEGFGSRVRSRQSEDLMASVDELQDEDRTDEAGGAGEEYTHERSLLISRAVVTQCACC